MNSRYVVLGLARPRSPWCAEVGRWATSGSAPLEFIRCVAREELTANLNSGRPFSAVLVDAASHGFDRDLIDLARTAGSATIVVDDGTVPRDWQALGAHSVLAGGFSRADLVLALDTHATPLPRVQVDPGALVESDRGSEILAPQPTNHRWITVLGAGAGSSVLAMALAQALGEDRSCPEEGAGVVLADLSLDADQAMMHGAPDIVPCVSELAEAFRSDRLERGSVRDLTFAVDGRGYHLLLGLRRHRDWAALRPRSVAAALDGLSMAFPVVVADTNADLEGEDDCGSVEVEERNVLARSAVRRADVVVAVGTGDLKGLHGLIRLLWNLRSFGVPPGRLLPVINRAPRHPRARAELTRAIRELGFGPLTPSRNDTGHVSVEGTLAGVVFVPHARRLDQVLRDCAPMPDGLGRPLARGIGVMFEERARLEKDPHRLGDTAGPPQPVRPGDLGRRFHHRRAN